MNIELVDAPEDVQYFGWALQHLPEGNTLSGLLAVPDALPPDVAVARVQDVYHKYFDTDRLVPLPVLPDYLRRDVHPLYAEIVGPNKAAEIEAAQDELYDADRHLPGRIDDLAYQAMLAGFLGAFDKDTTSVRWLATLLLRGSLNRQLTIGSFFRMLTGGELGAFESVLPTKSETVTLAKTLVSGDLHSEYQLAQTIRHYADFISFPPEPGSRPPRLRSRPPRPRSRPPRPRSRPPRAENEAPSTENDV
jgi:hypothetical protein